MKYWLMKSEPDEFSFTDLEKDGRTLWTGVRNYQARNFMTQEMTPGDLILFYHSNAQPPGVAGLAKVSKKAQVDPTQFEKSSDYYDAKVKPESPRWYCVEVEPVKALTHYVSLDEIRNEKSLKDMLVIKRGQRLSIQPVKKSDFLKILKMGGLFL